MNSNDLSSSGNATTDMMSKFGSPKARLAEIEFLVFVTTFLLVFLAAFGTYRRRSRSGFLKVVLWTTSTMSTYLIGYIFGLMQDFPLKDRLFLIWAMLLLIVFAFPDSFSIYSLDETEQWRRYYWQFAAKLVGFYVLSIWTLGFRGRFGWDTVLFHLFNIIVSLKFMTRLTSLFRASPSTIEMTAKFSQIYTKYEHTLSDQNTINPDTMRGYCHLVEVAGRPKVYSQDVTLHEEKVKKLYQEEYVVTLDKVWRCGGRLLTSNKDLGNRLKDICLSLCFLRILLLKPAGYSLPEEARKKMWLLFREGLLSDADRAFRVIEVELKLLYELLYTKYPVYTMKYFSKVRILEFLLSFAVYGLAAAYMSKYSDSLESVELGKLWGKNWDVLLTYILLGMVLLADIVQLVHLASSEWSKAHFIVSYVAKTSWQNNELLEKFIKMICTTHVSKPWMGMLGQYSLIESQGYAVRNSFIYGIGLIFIDWNMVGQRERKAVHLSDEVKQAVLNSLRYDEPTLDRGRASLRRNGVCENLPRACEEDHEAKDILVWHIATSYFQHKSSSFQSSSINCKIVSDLSNYLAYLVCFAPRLLPGPPFEPQFQFITMLKQASVAFKGCQNVEDKIRKLEDLSEMEDRGIITNGARLGKQLLQLGNEKGEYRVWQILAEFWSEMSLCAATSDNVKAHLEKLASGGEFITHLWALVHHACFTSAHPASAI